MDGLIQVIVGNLSIKFIIYQYLQTISNGKEKLYISLEGKREREMETDVFRFGKRRERCL